MNKERSDYFKDILKDCTLCPHSCHVDRTKNEMGLCNASDTVKISQALPHFGEEPPISGKKGSGTIFFTNCNMKCQYCQNYQISQKGSIEFSNYISKRELADIMISLKEKGCHNINLVSPTIWTANIVESIIIAKDNGLDIPVLYNCGGYEKLETIKELDGLIDIYMPDMRYSSDSNAFKYSKVKEYVKNNRESIIEMHKQVKDLKIDEEDIAQKGLLIRLLVMPNDISGTKDTLSFIAKELPNKTHLSIMSQFRPVYLAKKYERINRGLTVNEYMDVISFAKDLGFENAFIQDCIGLEKDPYLPDFKNKDVFEQD